MHKHNINKQNMHTHNLTIKTELKKLVQVPCMPSWQKMDQAYSTALGTNTEQPNITCNWFCWCI